VVADGRLAEPERLGQVADTALLSRNPAEVEGDATEGDDRVGFGVGAARAHLVRERLVAIEPGVSGAE
jgi:hypothetical protein